MFPCNSSPARQAQRFYKCQLEKVTDVSTCSCRSPFDVGFLGLTQTWHYLVVTNKTYGGLPGHRQRMLRHLEGGVFNRQRITNRMVCSPSMTTLIFWTRPWTTWSVWAAVVRASSSVSRSSLSRTASISFSPKKFFTNLTA